LASGRRAVTNGRIRVILTGTYTRHWSSLHSTSTVILVFERELEGEEVTKADGQLEALMRLSKLAARSSNLSDAAMLMVAFTCASAAFWMSFICCSVAAKQVRLKKMKQKPILLPNFLQKALHLNIDCILIITL